MCTTGRLRAAIIRSIRRGAVRMRMYCPNCNAPGTLKGMRCPNCNQMVG